MYAFCSYWLTSGAVVHFRAGTGERDTLVDGNENDD